MKTKKKLIVSILVMLFVMLSIVATIAVVFAATQQTISTNINISYTVQDLYGTASATYKIGDNGEEIPLTAYNAGNQVIGDTLVFEAEDTENAGTLQFPEGAEEIALTSTDSFITIKYTYTNSGDRTYTATMSFEGVIEPENMIVEYGIWDFENNKIRYSADRYALTIPNGGELSYWIKISVESKAKSASFNGDFVWELEGNDKADLAYESLDKLYITGSDGAYSVSFNGSDTLENGEIVFPSSVNGDPVTAIVANADLTQEQKNQVTSVYVPDSVTTIEEEAFLSYSNLENVDFEQNETASAASAQSNNGLTIIKDLAFQSCFNLTDFIIPSTVTSVGNSAFAGCSGLTSIEIPKTLSSIGYGAFCDCTNLTSLTLNRNISIDVSTFQNCTALKNLTIGKDLTNLSIYNSDFPFIENVTVVSGHSKYHSAGNCVIETATQTLVRGFKASVIPTDGSVTSIKNNAFSGCEITSIEIPSSVTSIGAGAFCDCPSLTSVTLNEGLISIGDGAFANCPALTSITIPASVTYIGMSAFESPNLTSITFENTNGWFVATSPSATSGTAVDVSSANTNLISWLTQGYGAYINSIKRS